MYQPSQRASMSSGPTSSPEHQILEGLLAATHDGVMVVESDGMVTLKNGPAAEVFGQGWLGRPVSYVEFRSSFNLVSLEGTPLTDDEDPFLAAREGHGRRPMLLCVRHQDLERCLQVASTPLLGPDGEVERVLVTWRDLTEEMRLRHALTEKVDELEQAVSSLQELDRLKTDFLNNVSHELRTPLTAIIGYLEFLDEGIAGPLNPQQKEFLDYVSRSSEHLLMLINDLLDFARLEAGKLHFAPAPVEMGALMQQLVSTMKTRADSKDLALQLEVRQPLPPAKADYSRVLQILTNLLDNAIKFTPEGGKVIMRCRAHSDGRLLYLEVEDTGVGIPDHAMPHLFSKFYQVQSGLRREQGGTGLGLAIAKMLVEAQGGTIGLSSRLGQGTRVWFTLPTWQDGERLEGALGQDLDLVEAGVDDDQAPLPVEQDTGR